MGAIEVGVELEVAVVEVDTVDEDKLLCAGRVKRLAVRDAKLHPPMAG